MGPNPIGSEVSFIPIAFRVWLKKCIPNAPKRMGWLSPEGF
jgi:hypothetical protein